MNVCWRCDEQFEDREAGSRIEHEDDMYDRGLVPVIIMTCPKCGSDEIEEVDG